jgi:hypothetical protein
MYRRIYLSFPAPDHARRAVAALIGAGVPLERIHAIAKEGTDLSALPLASEGQRHDRVARLEDLFWYGNLGGFGLALLGLAASALNGSPLGASVSVAIMLATYLAGRRFATRIPHAHLSELRVPLGHGEVGLLVDVPVERVHEIEHLVSQRHPEIGVAGVGWTLKSLGV